MYTYNGIITHVVDGDTMDIQLDLGFKISFNIRVRLAAINCPELSTQEGQQAASFVRQFENSQVVVNTVKDRKDDYGRYLAYVTVNYNNQLTQLNQLLLDLNLAKPYP